MLSSSPRRTPINHTQPAASRFNKTPPPASPPHPTRVERSSELDTLASSAVLLPADEPRVVTPSARRPVSMPLFEDDATAVKTPPRLRDDTPTTQHPLPASVPLPPRTAADMYTAASSISAPSPEQTAPPIVMPSQQDLLRQSAAAPHTNLLSHTTDVATAIATAQGPPLTTHVDGLTQSIVPPPKGLPRLKQDIDFSLSGDDLLLPGIDDDNQPSLMPPQEPIKPLSVPLVHSNASPEVVIKPAVVAQPVLQAHPGLKEPPQLDDDVFGGYSPGFGRRGGASPNRRALSLTAQSLPASPLAMPAVPAKVVSTHTTTRAPVTPTRAPVVSASPRFNHTALGLLDSDSSDDDAGASTSVVPQQPRPAIELAPSPLTQPSIPAASSVVQAPVTLQAIAAPSENTQHRTVPEHQPIANISMQCVFASAHTSLT